jgi:hypothetical protein
VQCCKYLASITGQIYATTILLLLLLLLLFLFLPLRILHQHRQQLYLILNHLKNLLLLLCGLRLIKSWWPAERQRHTAIISIPICAGPAGPITTQSTKTRPTKPTTTTSSSSSRTTARTGALQCPMFGVTKRHGLLIRGATQSHNRVLPKTIMHGHARHRLLWLLLLLLCACRRLCLQALPTC